MIRAMLVDVDGTVALRGDRSPYDETKVHLDAPNLPVIKVLNALRRDGYQPVFLSGRTEACRDATWQWLDEHVGMGPWLHEAELFMRKVGDTRQDAIVKREIYETRIRDRYDVLCVLDDRNQVVRMWRELGLTVLQVADGDF